jgi:hypothetical protein
MAAMIRKTLFASALAGALALTSVTAQPAFAAPDGEDYAKILLGILAAGAIAKALENERDRERAAERARQDPVWVPDNRRHRSRDLPQRCEFEVRTRHGWTDVFGKRCLEREGVRIGRLPDACEFDVRTDRGRRSVFGARCLRDYGWTVEARRR